MAMEQYSLVVPCVIHLFTMSLTRTSVRGTLAIWLLSNYVVRYYMIEQTRVDTGVNHTAGRRNS